MLREGAGKKGMVFFPFVFSLFMFVLTANLLGMFPYFFTVTSQIIVTFALACLVIGTVIVYGFYKHGLHFLGVFAPSGVPAALLPLVSAIEVISFLSRPISLSVRLFANMLAGHITLKVFAGFVASMSALGAIGVGGAILPLLMTVAMTALEFLVAFLITCPAHCATRLLLTASSAVWYSASPLRKLWASSRCSLLSFSCSLSNIGIRFGSRLADQRAVILRICSTPGGEHVRDRGFCPVSTGVY